MSSPPDPDQAARIRSEFAEIANLSPKELAAWLETEESRKVGTTRPGERESVGRQAGRRILAIKKTRVADLSADHYAHMGKVIGYVRRHRAQRPWGDVTHTRWRWSLMNWGHDPLKTGEL